MNIASLRSSRSSYGDSRYLSSYSNNGQSLIPPRNLVDSYRGMLDTTNDDRTNSSMTSPRFPRPSTQSVDVTDPVLMHLLTETAISDSQSYQILPFEEVEDLKREYTILLTRIEAVKRKLALETKMRDAAQSLGRLPPNHSRTGAGDVNNDDELGTTAQRCDDLAQELFAYERNAQEIHKKLLEHTAGILQLTHRGLKKNVKNDGGQSHLSTTNGVARGATSDFDDRSLYRTIDYLDDFGLFGKGGNAADPAVIRNTENKLDELNRRMRDFVIQNNLSDPQDFDPLPNKITNGDSVPSLAGLQAHLTSLENTVNIIQNHGLQGSGENRAAEAQLQEANARLHALLGQAGSSHSAAHPPPPSPSGENFQLHVDYLHSGLDNLQRSLQGLNDQKTILTTQIQQQRELNSKSDAERDVHVADLTRQLVEIRKDFELSEREGQSVREELALVTEQLEAAKQRNEESSSMAKEVSGLKQELQAAQAEAARYQEELRNLEGEVARAQTELTVVKAELDGAYGTRAQRAAEVAANPAIQKEIDDLNTRNISLMEEIATLKAERENQDAAASGDLQQRVQVLEKELRETIEDYEAMTKASVEMEKERDRYENTIDGLRDRIENLEAQLSDERITLMGMNNSGSANIGPETTSTMVLKNEFKKMMRDTRAENLKALKAEQEERKRLEALLRNLRKEQSHGKTNLSQSTIAS